MKIQNTITQPQLEMLLRLANAMHMGNPAWRYGQSVSNALQTILPDLAEEVRGDPKVDPFNWPEDYGTRWTQWYAAVCPDPIRLAPGTTCPMCGLEIESEFDMHESISEEEELEPIRSCGICGGRFPLCWECHKVKEGYVSMPMDFT